MNPSSPGYIPNSICYAVKEHMYLETSSVPLVATYACNDPNNDGQIYTNMNLYRPEIVGISLPHQ